MGHESYVDYIDDDATWQRLVGALLLR